MKKIILTGLGAAILFASASCRKTYEDEPLDRLTENEIYDDMDKNANYAKLALDNIYSFLPNGYNRISGAVLEAGSDDAMSSSPGHATETFTNGRLSPTNNPDNSWSRNYQCIRRANVFLSKIDVVPTDEQQKSYWKAEARFIRAMSYFELMKRFGGVPLLEDRVLTIEDDLNIPRNTFDECLAYVIGECDAIYPLLRQDITTAGDWGRISRGAALALKSRLLLYAASPWHNPSNNPEKWVAARAAADAVISYGKFSLNSSYANVFVTRSLPEIILAFQRGVTNDVEVNNGPVGFTGALLGKGATSPTQELVDAFPMLNGQAISSGTSGYDPKDPYKNRDPRFYATIFHNGMRWLKRNIETFEGGLDKPGGTIPQTQTGYYMRKFMANHAEGTAYASQTHNFIIFRYAEILLNFAEAGNELGDVASAHKQLIALRKRAGITAGADGNYGLKAPGAYTVADMRQAIMLERRIEMAFEEQRFWDIRRWKTAEVVLNGQLNGMKITKDAVSGALTYTRTPVKTVSFNASRMYLYPIPYDLMSKSEALTQNPNW